MKKICILSLTSILACGAFATDGATLYKQCAVCHGTRGEKKALNKSNIINTMSTEQIKTALEGYKAGTLNINGQGKMMSMQVKILTPEDVDILSQYIPTLKQNTQ